MGNNMIALIKNKFSKIIKSLLLIFTITIVLIVVIVVFFLVINRMQRKIIVPDGYANARWYAEYDKEDNKAFVMEWKSYVYWRRKPFQGKYINVNEAGIRRTFSLDAGDNDRRKLLKLFMFGGSTLWSTGARDDYTIPSYLVKELSKMGIKSEITNFGESGYVTTQEVIALLLQLQKGNVPDIVIYYDGVNDTIAPSQGSAPGLPQNEMNRRAEFNLLHSPIKAFAFWFNFVGKKANQIALKIHKPTLDQYKIETDANGVINSYLGNIKIVRALGEKYGFSSYFFWQPTIFTKEKLTPYEQQQLEMDEYRLIFEKTYDIMWQRNQEFVNQNFYNISNIFAKNTQPIFIDVCHITEDGNGIIAENMARKLQQQLQTK
jgi:lysophospholipase L1-like esterase